MQFTFRQPERFTAIKSVLIFTKWPFIKALDDVKNFKP